jgi:hypothetical protein
MKYVAIYFLSKNQAGGRQILSSENGRKAVEFTPSTLLSLSRSCDASEDMKITPVVFDYVGDNL